MPFSNILNAKFFDDPLALLRTPGNAICGHDNMHLAITGARVAMAGAAAGGWAQANALVNRMNERKLISFDFVAFKHDLDGGGSMMMQQPRFDTALLDIARPAGMPEASSNPIQGYWFPYLTSTPQQLTEAKNGAGPPSVMGWVDVPKRRPAYKYAFTGSMQGCHIVVTRSPAGADYFRFYHYQSPGTVKKLAGDMAMKHWPIRTGGEPVFWLDDTMYAAHAPEAVDAFNFLHYHDDAWYCVSQRNERKTHYQTQIGRRMPGSDTTITLTLPYFDSFILRDVVERGPIADVRMSDLFERYAAWPG